MTQATLLTMDPSGEAFELVAEDPRSRELVELARRVAASEATVMLNGESGVGKEVYARFIHAHSLRADGPFVAVNCAAIPENMLEAMLFGHERGAFTGAYESRPGKFELAEGGTLLLDEISEMDLSLQAKLLRVLQEREVERLGGRRPMQMDVRVLATSNRNLMQAVAEGKFREDLFYRLNVFPLVIPPLRERPGDILPLARRLIYIHGRGIDRARLSTAAAARLMDHIWPGNVRELDNVIQRAMILRDSEELDAASIHFETMAPPLDPGHSRIPLPPPPARKPSAWVTGCAQGKNN
ncbi:sigma-54 interaction domain-containing protein [Ectothiorhodospira shaposhnikovii]|uniref:sigma-54 interaction domain-containing protein n=1 Tax=Ectothiorhodospira shaposhnikovii TaxID=1054 RepID=UPI00237C24C0|nr:sigma 54-interacting transcriptional regulator [Ectothiorhodospira shaposhnikovii]